MNSRSPALKALGFLALAATLTLGARPASAATLSYTFVTPNNEANWGATYNLPKFDPALGTLQGITFLHEASFNAEVSVTHGTGPGFVQLATIGAEVEFAPPTAAIVALPLAPSPVVLAWSDQDASPTLFNIGPFSQNGLTVVNPVNFIAYTGLGSFDVFMDVRRVLGSISDSGGDFGSLDARIFGGGNLTVAYEYEPVPEPGLLALTLTGLGGLVAARRRRNS